MYSKSKGTVLYTFASDVARSCKSSVEAGRLILSVVAALRHGFMAISGYKRPVVYKCCRRATTPGYVQGHQLESALTMEDQLLTILAAIATTIVLGLVLMTFVNNHLQPCQPVMETSRDKGKLAIGNKDYERKSSH